MSKSEEGVSIYPEGVVSPREKLDYLKAVYGIDKPTLFDLMIKELIVDSFVKGFVTERWDKTTGDIAELYYNETFKSE